MSLFIVLSSLCIYYTNLLNSSIVLCSINKSHSAPDAIVPVTELDQVASLHHVANTLYWRNSTVINLKN